MQTNSVVSSYLGVREGLGNPHNNKGKEQIKAEVRIEATNEDVGKKFQKITCRTSFPGDVAKLNYGLQLKQKKKKIKKVKMMEETIIMSVSVFFFCFVFFS